MREILLVLMVALVHRGKKLIKTKFCLSLHFNSDYSYLFANEKEIHKFKASNKTNKFLSQFCQGSISNKFDYVDSKKYLLKEHV